MIRAFLCVGFWAVYTVLASMIAVPIALLTGNAEILWRLGIICARGGVWLSGIRIRAVGREKLDPRASYLFMSNHVSNLDPPIMVPLIYRPMSILAKKELFGIPVVGYIFKIGHLVPVDRSNRQAAIESVRKAVEVLRSGLSMVVYPEGTRSRNGRLLPFKKGPFHMAIESGVSVVPVTMIGTYEAWPKGVFRIKPVTVTVVFHEPVDSTKFKNREELMQTVRNTIESALPEQYRVSATPSAT